LKIYSEEESKRRISWMHQIFGNVRDIDGKNLGTSETLVFEVYVGYLCLGYVYIKVYVGCLKTWSVWWIKW
jgi:hypothetical protein